MGRPTGRHRYLQEGIAFGITARVEWWAGSTCSIHERIHGPKVPFRVFVGRLCVLTRQNELVLRLEKAQTTEVVGQICLVQRRTKTNARD